MEKEQLIQQMMQGQVNINMPENEFGPFPHIMNKNQLKISQSSKYKSQNYKILIRGAAS